MRLAQSRNGRFSKQGNWRSMVRADSIRPGTGHAADQSKSSGDRPLGQKSTVFYDSCLLRFERHTGGRMSCAAGRAINMCHQWTWTNGARHQHELHSVSTSGLAPYTRGGICRPIFRPPAPHNIFFFFSPGGGQCGGRKSNAEAPIAGRGPRCFQPSSSRAPRIAAPGPVFGTVCTAFDGSGTLGSTHFCRCVECDRVRPRNQCVIRPARMSCDLILKRQGAPLGRRRRAQELSRGALA